MRTVWFLVSIAAIVALTQCLTACSNEKCTLKPEAQQFQRECMRNGGKFIDCLRNAEAVFGYDDAYVCTRRLSK